LVLSGGYVASLYVWKGALTTSRNDPEMIKKRMLSVASVTLASPVHIAPFSPHACPSYHLIPHTSSSYLIPHTRSTWVSSPSHLPSSAKRPRWSLFALLQATLRRQYHLNFDLAANILLLCLCLCASFCVCLCLRVSVSVSVSVSACVVRACVYGLEHYAVCVD
jgi:hypothetical protein